MYDATGVEDANELVTGSLVLIHASQLLDRQPQQVGVDLHSHSQVPEANPGEALQLITELCILLPVLWVCGKNLPIQAMDKELLQPFRSAVPSLLVSIRREDDGLCQHPLLQLREESMHSPSGITPRKVVGELTHKVQQFASYRQRRRVLELVPELRVLCPLLVLTTVLLPLGLLRTSVTLPLGLLWLKPLGAL